MSWLNSPALYSPEWVLTARCNPACGGTKDNFFALLPTLKGWLCGVTPDQYLQQWAIPACSWKTCERCGVPIPRPQAWDDFYCDQCCVARILGDMGFVPEARSANRYRLAYPGE